MFRVNTLPALACLPLLLAAAVQSGSCRGAAASAANAPAPAASKASAPESARRAPNRNDNGNTRENMNNAQEKKTGHVENGTWGGEHVRLAVREGGAGVEFDCARGTIDGPLSLDGEGRFDVRGAYVREHPGPVRLKVPRVSRPARYSGKVSGDEMSLTVTLTDTSEVLDALTLTRGSRGRVVKCR